MQALQIHVRSKEESVVRTIPPDVIMCSSMQCMEPAFARVRISGGGGDKVVTCNPCRECLRKIRDAETLRPKHWPALTVLVVPI